MNAKLDRYKKMIANMDGEYRWYYPRSKDYGRFPYNTIELAIGMQASWPDDKDALLYQGFPQDRFIMAWYGENDATSGE